jgi:hypothetical protein
MGKGTKRRVGATVLGLFAAAAFAASPAGGATATQLVSGTTLGVIGITAATPAVFGTTLSPGSTANSTLGTLTLVDTSPSWTLTAKDSGTGAGHMIAAAVGCGSSPAQLTNALSLSVAPVIPNGSITTATKSLSATDQTVASATAVPLAATVLNTNYAQTVDSNEPIQAGCLYSLTTTYTLQ